MSVDLHRVGRATAFESKPPIERIDPVAENESDLRERGRILRYSPNVIRQIHIHSDFILLLHQHVGESLSKRAIGAPKPERITNKHLVIIRENAPAHHYTQFAGSGARESNNPETLVHLF
jgi:hypothetical protein